MDRATNLCNYCDTLATYNIWKSGIKIKTCDRHLDFTKHLNFSYPHALTLDQSFWAEEQIKEN